MRRERNSTSSSAQRSFSARSIWSWGYSWLIRRSVTNQTREHILNAWIYKVKNKSAWKHTVKPVEVGKCVVAASGPEDGRQWSSTEMVTQWRPGRLAVRAGCVVAETRPRANRWLDPSSYDKSSLSPLFPFICSHLVAPGAVSWNQTARIRLKRPANYDIFTRRNLSLSTVVRSWH